MGTTVAPKSSSIAGSITSYGTQGGMLGGTLVDIGSVYNSLSDSGGVMAAARDAQESVGTGITDTVDPSKASKKNLTSSEVDAIVKRSDEIRSSAMSNKDKKIALSELLTGAGIPHDPNSLDPYSPSDNFGLLSQRINIVDPVSTVAASGGAIGGGISGVLESVIANAAAADAAGGGQTEEPVDLTADTTANKLLTGGNGSLGDSAELGTVSQDPIVDQATVSDVNETWTYNKATDSFISSTRGDSVRNAGNADLKDGGVYAVTPVLGTDGVVAENVVDTETNEPVGVFSIDINTGLPTITKPVDTVGSSGDGDTFNTVGDTLNTGETLTVGDTTGGDTAGDDITNGNTTGGDDFNTATDNNNTGQVLTVGDTTATVIKGNDGTDGTDGNDGNDGNDGATGASGADGRDGKDGKDGRDGIIGLFSAIQSTPITDSLFFEPKFTELDNIPVGMFERFLQATGGR